MPHSKQNPLLDHTAINPFLPMRLFVFLRWIALFGQAATITTTYFGFGFSVPWIVLGPLLAVSALINIILTVDDKDRLSAHQICLYLLYDLGQLTAMIFVTGGLNNPFILLMIVPVAIASGFLPRQYGFIITSFYFLAIFTLTFTPYPLPWYNQGLEQPLELKVGILIAMLTGAAFTSYFMGWISRELQKLSQALMATQMALGREQKIASLGALAAAAAHELGSPLSTIMLAAKDLEQQDLPTETHQDIVLIHDEVKRCRDILQNLSLNFSQEHQMPLPSLPISAAIQWVVDRYSPQNQSLIKLITQGTGDEPSIVISPEWVHGLDNILQNACQFAENQVFVKILWRENKIEIMIRDDGQGYPSDILPYLGEPYRHGRKETTDVIHLGLGLFIAKTLLEQWGAQLFFYNENGACCLISKEET